MLPVREGEGDRRADLPKVQGEGQNQAAETAVPEQGTELRIVKPPKEVYALRYYEPSHWKRAQTKIMEYCALCGRRLHAGESCLKATYRADRGVYAQTYHVRCGLVARAWGQIPQFRSHSVPIEWAYQHACADCREKCSCRKNPFDCVQAVNELRYEGGVRAERGEGFDEE